MKLLVALLMPMFAAQALVAKSPVFNNFYNDAIAPLYKVTCDYQYQIQGGSEDFIIDQFHAFSRKGMDGKIRFHVTRDKIPAYFFQLNADSSYGEPVWHQDAELDFTAVLEGETLVYHARFKNYRRDKTQLAVLWEEVRELNMAGLKVLGYSNFDFLEGISIMSQYDSSPWVNERGVEILECAVENFGSGAGARFADPFQI